MVIRFDARNPRAERWLRAASSNLVTEIIDDQRAGIRQALTQGMEAGSNPRTVALDIVGRVNLKTGKSEGGLVGLTSGQMRWVENARAELADPEIMGQYFQRKRRDKRYDSTVAKALREGKPLSRGDIARITGRYADRLLKLRGDTIGRTEAMASLHAAQVEAMRQLVDTGKVRAEQVRKVWHATKDKRTRDGHRALDGESIGLNERFTSPETGALMEHPGDTLHGAHGEDVINCRCYMAVRVDYLGNL